MSSKQIAQKVIDFEYSRITANDQPPAQAHDEEKLVDRDRYSFWGLTDSIRKLGLEEELCDVRWIGYGDKCYIEAFILCLLGGFKNQHEINNNYFTKTKYGLYQICQRYLSIGEQKQFVQILCSWQYTNDAANYLSKNNALVFLIEKIFKLYISSLYQFLQPIEELKLFSLNFPFLTLQIASETSAVVNSFDHKFFIIAEKGCIFVVEANRQKYATKESLKTIYKDQISSQASSACKNQKSTPKFIPKGESYMESSRSRRLNSISEVNVECFEDKNKNLIVKNQKYNFLMKKKKKSPRKSEAEKDLQRKFYKMSLRNTIDMHIANLQRFTDRRKKTRESPQFQTFFVKNNSRSKQRMQREKQQRLKSLINKQKSTENQHRSPSSSQMTVIIPPLKAQCKNKTRMHLRTSPNSSVSSPSNFVQNHQRILFTYQYQQHL